MEKVGETASTLEASQEVSFRIDCRPSGSRSSDETAVWSEQYGEGWRFGVYLSWKRRARVRPAVDLRTVDYRVSYIKLSASVIEGDDELPEDSTVQVLSGYMLRLPNSNLEPLSEGSELPWTGSNRGFIHVTFRVVYPLPSSFSGSLRTTLNQTLVTTLSGGSFNDTKFLVFSRRRQSGRVDAPLALFANSAILKTNCAYFEPLLSERFMGTSISALNEDQYDYYSDSDLSDCSEDTQDESYRAAEWQDPDLDDTGVAARSTVGDTAALPIEERDGALRTVVVTDSAYRTYKALIYYLYTGDVSFASLRSGYPAIEGEERTPATGGSDDSPRCSPKSMYRLADKLGLEELKKKAFLAIKSELSGTNIVKEAFSRFASIPEYAEIREMEVSVLSQNWHIPRVKEDLLALIKKAMQGELPHATDAFISFVARMSVR
ncbi:hypothetical protein GLOTRDRAFT_137867 [Gloeophyllum trabeum ATCC 11539]|uniref:BTB domain-containing protein n=1 Tax=Gloeophyllum trabeum (strain ATCC 11539 / FP-39264 / Madison 617) TaxID=670483 RepID=S7RSE9_GLOTA|nr:uncharacterized protein GLOTRDRAFT_137867 [Gloeophyllum trabeum ATCC 11539]EPQ57565.1 hypothetical protein GLOTRDRAFT_137867 [Gloeophyllum trabeum ATCC 11539]